MYFIRYIGRKARKFDNVAGTGLSWLPGQIQAIHDDEKASRLLAYADIWEQVDEAAASAEKVPTPAQVSHQDNTKAGLPPVPATIARQQEEQQASEVAASEEASAEPAEIPNHVPDKVPPVVTQNVVAMKKPGRPSRQLPN
jgi:hypothetical protein